MQPAVVGELDEQVLAARGRPQHLAAGQVGRALDELALRARDLGRGAGEGLVQVAGEGEQRVAFGHDESVCRGCGTRVGRWRRGGVSGARGAVRSAPRGRRDQRSAASRRIRRALGPKPCRARRSASAAASTASHVVRWAFARARRAGRAHGLRPRAGARPARRPPRQLAFFSVFLAVVFAGLLAVFFAAAFLVAAFFAGALFAAVLVGASSVGPRPRRRPRSAPRSRAPRHVRPWPSPPSGPAPRAGRRPRRSPRARRRSPAPRRPPPWRGRAP